METRFSIKEQSSGDITTVAFNSQHRVAAACADNTVRVYRVDTGARVGTLYGHTGPVNAVLWANSGRIVATAAEDGK